MDFDPIKKFFSLLLTALGLFVIIGMIYATFLISKMAEKPQTIEKSNASEMISIFPSLKIKE